MKVTTSPASSAFMVMMSSLSAHFSILDCGGKERFGSGQRVFFADSRSDAGTEGEVSRSARVREAACIARFVERACRQSVLRERSRDPKSRPPPSVVPGGVSSSREVSRFGSAHFQNNAFSSAIPKRQLPSKGGKGTGHGREVPEDRAVHSTERTMLVRFMPMVMLRSQR